MSRWEAISLTVESCFISKLLLKIISAYWFSTNETLWSTHHKELFSQHDRAAMDFKRHMAWLPFLSLLS
jgi:hypothetical protein